MKDSPANDTDALDRGADSELDSSMAERDCEALAQCMGALYGRAAAVREVRGGAREEGLSEPERAALPRAIRALARLSWMRARPEQRESARVLIAHYVFAGPARRDHRWLHTLRCALMERPARVLALLTARSKGPDAMAQRVAAQRMVQRAEAHYRAAREVASDGLWLTLELAALSKAVREAESDRAAVDAARKDIAAKATRGERELENTRTEHLTIPGQLPMVLSSSQVRPANERSRIEPSGERGSNAASPVNLQDAAGVQPYPRRADGAGERGEHESSAAPSGARRKAVP